jgi:hypothetical protein
VQYRGGGAIGSFRTGISIHKNFTLFNIGIAKFIFLIRGKKKASREEGKVPFKPIRSVECRDKKCTLGKIKS